MHFPQNKLLGFTLVELIVVITIVGILSTVGFVSYSGYLTGARDSNRFSQMTKLSDSLQTYAAAKSLPLPDDSIDITASGSTNVIAYQGYVGVDVLETIDYTNGGKDPKDDSYFTYYLTKDRKSMQLLTFMEESVASHLSQTYAADYEDRTPKTYGKKLGVLVSAEAGTINTPAQEISANTSSGYLDVVTTTNSYTAVLSEDEILEGTGSILSQTIQNSSCKRIKQTGGSKGNGVYTISPQGIDMQVYCDMDTDGGGWTRTHLLDHNALPPTAAAYRLLFSQTQDFSDNGFTTDIDSWNYEEYIYLSNDSKTEVEILNTDNPNITAGYKNEGMEEWVNAYIIGNTTIPARGEWYYYDEVPFKEKFTIGVGDGNGSWNAGYYNMGSEKLLNTSASNWVGNMPFTRRTLTNTSHGWCIGGDTNCGADDWASLWIR